MAADLPDTDPDLAHRHAWGVLLFTDDQGLVAPLRVLLAGHGIGLTTAALTGGRDAPLRVAGQAFVDQLGDAVAPELIEVGAASGL